MPFSGRGAKTPIRIRRLSRNYPVISCPKCNYLAARHSIGKRNVRDISLKCPTVYVITYSKHFCDKCYKFFNAPMDDISPPSSGYTQRTRKLVLTRMLEDKLNINTVKKQLLRDLHVDISAATIYRWMN